MKGVKLMSLTRKDLISSFFAAVFLVVFMSGFGLAQEHGSNHSMMIPSEFNWVDGPPSLPPGIKVAVLEGDPSKEGPFMMRIQLPADYKIPPHFHPAIEHVTVISGSFYMGHGEQFKPDAAKELTPGGVAVMATGERHYAFTKKKAEIQLHGIGPWGITYVNSKEDPRNQVVRN
jgi:quercetin dioxygenase-like cupin family protein